MPWNTTYILPLDQLEICESSGQQCPQYAKVLDQVRCASIDALKAELARVESLGGEGLMLRQPRSQYEAGRSSTLLKLKRFHDAEGRVVEHLPGKGRHAGRLGAVVVELPDGKTFSVGTGFSDAQRRNPPAIGSTITYRFQELTDRGVPRFPSFVRLRIDEAQPTRDVQRPARSKQVQQEPSETAMKRYFEFVEGSSSKFWEITTSDKTVAVRFGRIGTNGQTQTKALADADAATKHAEKLIKEKMGKGYKETAAS
jgi:DNA ligase-1